MANAGYKALIKEQSSAIPFSLEPTTSIDDKIYQVSDTAKQIFSYESEITAYEKFIIEDCEDTWDEYVDTNVTSTIDAVDFKAGAGSVKLDVADTAGTGIILATEAITSLDISSTDTMKLWIKSNITTTQGDLQLLLDDTPDCASPLETLNIPALTSGEWTNVELTLSNPGSLTAIISVGLKYLTDLGTCTIHLDEIEATDGITAEEYTLDRLNGSVIFPNAKSRIINLSGDYVTLVTVAEAKGFSFDGVTDMGDITVFQDGDRNYKPLLQSGTATIDKFYTIDNYFVDMLYNREIKVIEFYADSEGLPFKCYALVSADSLALPIESLQEESISLQITDGTVV